ncbi:MAG: glycine zipper 2TM domain-containing protein [Allosphingosinicella sp.]|uniref:glycine zipper 2TM domain-containing protein n=1 Tax=Allosphingosinicella sp. TaxID=2823234 RepID=UPI00395139A7
MKKVTIAAVLAAAATLGLAAPAAAQSRADQQRWEDAQRRFDRERSIYEAERDRYEAARHRDGRAGSAYGDPFATDYDAARDYRHDPRAPERALTARDEVYRGSDGRYYCRRSDGTTGLVIGGAAGGILGNVIDGGRNRAAGTLIGGALGALLGRAVEQNNDLRCR